MVSQAKTTPRRPGTPLAIPAVLCATALLGCKSFEAEARERFSDAVSCPTSKVEVRELEGVSAHEVREKYDTTPKPTPPPEVAADPERLEVWEKKQAKLRADRTEPGFGSDVFEATGCGETITYECWRKKKSVNGQSSVDCTDIHRERTTSR